jgi:hypothetical protein
MTKSILFTQANLMLLSVKTADSVQQIFAFLVLVGSLDPDTRRIEKRCEVGI